ncbi:ATP-binding cassette domain-containing protein [Paenibacillus sp. FSL P2-0089]|uniref:ATP-binding cassette domain-containing protein n=1 Tax=Paenibacillus sp. FSL P2-0089 TaxID=2954526 RepID=UPI00315AD00A
MSVEVEALSKKYGSNQVINQLSFQINKGIFGLLGDNGAGKTTLMKILATLLGFNEGDVSMFGYSLRKEPDAIRAMLGYLPQNFDFFPDATITESMNYFAALKGLIGQRRIQEEISQRLVEVGLEEHAHKKIKQLSGGMKQRFGIAQAMLNLPQLLIIDEPTVGLDPKERIAFRNLLHSFSEDRIVLLSTHIVPDISSTCDNVLILKKGSCLYNGSVDEAIHKVEGKIWLVEVDKGQLQQLSNESRIISVVRKRGLMQVRLLDNSPPEKYGEYTLETPNLEDAYLYISDNERGP